MKKIACIMLAAMLIGCSTGQKRAVWRGMDSDILANRAVQECSKDVSNKMVSEQEYVKCLYFNYGLLIGYKYRVMEE